MHPALEAPRRTGDEKIVQATSNQAIEGAGAKCWPWIERDTASLLLRYRRHNNVLVMSAWSAFANPPRWSAETGDVQDPERGRGSSSRVRMQGGTSNGVHGNGVRPTRGSGAAWTPLICDQRNEEHLPRNRRHQADAAQGRVHRLRNGASA